MDYTEYVYECTSCGVAMPCTLSITVSDASNTQINITKKCPLDPDKNSKFDLMEITPCE